MSSNNSYRMKQLFPVTETNPQIYIDSVQLVRKVKNHPIIYDSWMRRDQFAVFAAWEEIIESLLPCFRTISDDSKASIRRKFRMRWSWMRSTLRRDLTRNRLFTHMHYKWMEELQYLIPYLVKRQGSKSASSCTQNFVTSTTATPPPRDATTTNVRITSDSDETLIQAFISSFAFDGLNVTDPDKNFLLAILNALRRVDTPRKEVLKSTFVTVLQE